MYKYEWNDIPPRCFLLEHGSSMLTKNKLYSGKRAGQGVRSVF